MRHFCIVSNHRHARPVFATDAFFSALPGGADPSRVHFAAHQSAWIVAYGEVQGCALHGIECQCPDGPADTVAIPLTDEQVTRVRELMATDGEAVFAQLWSLSSAVSLPGALWRLHTIAALVARQPESCAADFESGRAHVPVAEAIAGIADPPRPSDVKGMVTDVLLGVGGGELGMTLHRVAAFAQVLAAGRLCSSDSESATKQAAGLLDTARELDAAAKAWYRNDLN